MTFHRQNKRKKSSFFWIVVTIIVISVSLFAANSYFQGALSNAVKEQFSYIHTTAANFSASAASAGNFFTKNETLLKEKELLKKEIETLRLQLSENIILKIQNNALSKYTTGVEIDAPKPKRTKAKIIMQQASAINGSLLLSGDMGRVSIGDIVLIDNTYALGNIISKTEHTATVYLYTAPGRRVDALIHTKESVVALRSQGRGYGNLAIDAPRGTELIEGDIIFSKESSQYAIAKIGLIKQNPTDEYIKVLARLPQGINTLQYVLIEEQYANK